MNTGVEFGDFLPKLKVEIILEDELVDKAVEQLLSQPTLIALEMVRFLSQILRQ